MKNDCEKIREQIPAFMASVLSAQEAQTVQSHIDSCAACRQYLEAMQHDDLLLTDFAKSMQPAVGRLEQAVKAAIETATIRRSPRYVEILAGIVASRTARFAAAAMLLISVGFLAGLAWGWRLNTEHLRNSLEASLKQELQSVMASSYAALKDELRDEYRQDLNLYAVQTLAASNVATNQLLSELVAAINTSRAREQEGILAALGQVEANRIRENNELRKDLATFASYTGDNLSQTRQEMAELWAYTRPGDVETKPSKNR
jgi:hypothetical protein